MVNVLASISEHRFSLLPFPCLSFFFFVALLVLSLAFLYKCKYEKGALEKVVCSGLLVQTSMKYL